MKTNHNLKKFRDKIDVLDLRIQNLIQKRAQFALKIGEIKRETNHEMSFYQPKREKQIFENIKSQNSGPLNNTQVIVIFREILNACRSVQQSIHVAYLGPEGTYSEEALRAHFGQNVTAVPVHTIRDVLNTVKSQNGDYGIVPIANSTTGLISANIEILTNFDLSIYGEIILPIHHNLMSTQSSNAQITRIYSHEQSLKQCALWLKTHFPTVEKIALDSNALAAQAAADDKASAAIASASAAQIYSLNILAENINDNPDNETRFAILGRKKDMI